MARMNASTNRFDPYPDLSLPGEVGQPVRRRSDQDGRARSGRTEMVEFREAGENITSRKLPGKTTLRGRDARSRSHLRHGVSRTGPTWSTTSPATASPVSASSARTSPSMSSTRPGVQGALLQPLPLLGLGVPGAARSRCRRQRGGDHHHQARIRVVRARLERERGSAVPAVVGEAGA